VLPTAVLYFITLCGVCAFVDVEVSVQRIPEYELHWKNQVIIVCTITVAMEMLMIILMVMFWRQIRWTLMKLRCSCVRFYYHRLLLFI